MGTVDQRQVRRAGDRRRRDPDRRARGRTLQGPDVPVSREETMQIRRVATGQDAQGKSHVVSDVVVEAASVDGTVELALLWGADAPPSFPLSGEQPVCPSYFPT